jgi:Tfp pilus assembly protein FimT
VRSDAGVTLMELMVGLTIMTIFMGMFTGAAVMMYSSTSKAETIGETASQLSIAFSRLDTSVRYASAINTPAGPDGAGNWYVEWNGLSRTGASQCTQLQFDVTDRQLKQRVWGSTTTTEPSFVPLASEVQLAGDVGSNPDHHPFRLITGAGLPHQQLAIYLVAQAMSRAGPTTSVSDVTFTAFNSPATAGADVCMDWGRP